MKKICSIILLLYIFVVCLTSQEVKDTGARILFHGLVMDASTQSPLAYSQIIINRIFSSVSNADGTFTFYVNRHDTVVFSRLGYKSTSFYVRDTLAGREFIAGIYMHVDTLSIGEVIIVPRLSNLKSEIMNAKTEAEPEMDNARYNVAISAYQGRNSQNTLGDPATNYELLRRKQRVNAYEKGGIPSDKMIGLSPLLLIPVAYLLIHGLPEKPAPMKQTLTKQELDQIQKKYLETLKQKR